MRGHKLHFYRLNAGESVSFFVLSEPLRYSAHFVTEIDGSTISKKNCHVDECPFCEMGIPLRSGVYVIILMEGSKLSFFDITKAMYREMSRSARSHCDEFGEEFVNMGLFLSKHLITVTKIADAHRTFSGYEVSYTDVDAEDVRTMKNMTMDFNSKLGKKYQQLIIEMPDLVRPGTPEEDREVILHV